MQSLAKMKLRLRVLFILLTLAFTIVSTGHDVSAGSLSVKKMFKKVSSFFKKDKEEDKIDERRNQLNEAINALHKKREKLNREINKIDIDQETNLRKLEVYMKAVKRSPNNQEYADTLNEALEDHSKLRAKKNRKQQEYDKVVEKLSELSFELSKLL